MASEVKINATVNEALLASSTHKGIKMGAQKATPINIPVKINSDSLKNFQRPLGSISGDLNQFQKSLDASVARVLAFGASASVISGVASALKSLVESSIEVQKSLADINVVFGLTESELNNFSSGLFDVARNTGTAFSDVSSAATELARQGLSTEETLSRLNDALVLTRLSGLESVKSVETLTATINGFKDEAITSAQVVNRLAAVDQAFAVSSQDLANALARSGSVAQGAKVSFNELVAVVTSVQQTTARGGAVIGNALKSIFTRLQRDDVRQTLEELGIATQNAMGEFRSGIDILKDYSGIYDTLTDAQKASTAEQIAGVYQINTLKSLVKDLSGEYSIYEAALRKASSATDEAYVKNEQLNKTIAALLAQTQASLKEFGGIFGELVSNKAVSNILKIVDKIAQGLNKILDPETGSNLAKAFVGAIGDFIAGPGLIILGGASLKLLKFLISQAATAFKEIRNINTEKSKQIQLEGKISTLLSKNTGLLDKIANLEGNRKAQQALILSGIKQQEAYLRKVLSVQQAIARAAASGAVSMKGGFPSVRKGKAGGFIPNFYQPKQKANQSEVISETIAARSIGYEPGSVYKTKIYDGQGGSFKSVVNEAEKVKTVKGPNGKKGTYVINPLMARGFIPNFHGLAMTVGSKTKMVEEEEKPPKPIDLGYQKNLGLIYSGKTSGVNTFNGRWFTKMDPKDKYKQEFRVKLNESGFNAKKAIKPEDLDLESRTFDVTKNFINGYIKNIDPNATNLVKSKSDFANIGAFNGYIGNAFETAVDKVAGNIGKRYGGQSAAIDFPRPSQNLRELFNNMPGQYEAKYTNSDQLRNSVAEKYIKTFTPDLLNRKPQKRPARRKRGRGGDVTASGFIPNFVDNALSDAISREKGAGIPASKIRVSRSSLLENNKNPMGLAVTNTIDEPRGLKDVPKQVITQTISSAGGFIPNFAEQHVNFGGAGQKVEKMLNGFAQSLKDGSLKIKDVNKTLDYMKKNGTITAKEQQIYSKKLTELSKQASTTKKGMMSMEKQMSLYFAGAIAAQTLRQTTGDDSAATKTAEAGLNALFTQIYLLGPIGEKAGQSLQALGKGMGFLSKAMGWLAGLAKYGAAIGAVGAKLGGVLRLLFMGLSKLAGPMGWILSAAVALLPALIKLAKGSDESEKAIEKLSTKIAELRGASESGQEFVTNIKSAFDKLKEAEASGSIEEVEKAQRELSKVLSSAPKEFKDLGGEINNSTVSASELAEKYLPKLDERLDAIGKQTSKAEAELAILEGNMKKGAVAIQAYYKELIKANEIDMSKATDALENLLEVAQIKTKTRGSGEKRAEELAKAQEKLSEALGVNINLTGMSSDELFDLHKTLTQGLRITKEEVAAENARIEAAKKAIQEIQEYQQAVSDVEKSVAKFLSKFDEIKHSLDMTKLYSDIASENSRLSSEMGFISSKTLDLVKSYKDLAFAQNEASLTAKKLGSDLISSFTGEIGTSEFRNKAGGETANQFLEAIKSFENSLNSGGVVDTSPLEDLLSRIESGQIKGISTSDSIYQTTKDQINQIKDHKRATELNTTSTKAAINQLENTISGEFTKANTMGGPEAILELSKAISNINSGGDREQLDGLNQLSSVLSKFGENVDTVNTLIVNGSVAAKNWSQNIQDAATGIGISGFEESLIGLQSAVDKASDSFNDRFSNFSKNLQSFASQIKKNEDEIASVDRSALGGQEKIDRLTKINDALKASIDKLRDSNQDLSGTFSENLFESAKSGMSEFFDRELAVTVMNADEIGNNIESSLQGGDSKTMSRDEIISKLTSAQESILQKTGGEIQKIAEAFLTGRAETVSNELIAEFGRLDFIEKALKESQALQRIEKETGALLIRAGEIAKEADSQVTSSIIARAKAEQESLKSFEVAFNNLPKVVQDGLKPKIEEILDPSKFSFDEKGEIQIDPTALINANKDTFSSLEKLISNTEEVSLLTAIERNTAILAGKDPTVQGGGESSESIGGGFLERIKDVASGLEEFASSLGEVGVSAQKQSETLKDTSAKSGQAFDEVSSSAGKASDSVQKASQNIEQMSSNTERGFGKMGDGVNYLSDRVGTVTQTFGNTSQELVKLQSSAAGAGEGFIQMGSKVVTLKDGVMTSIDNMSDSSLRFKSTSDASKIASDLASQGFQFLGATVKEVGGTSEVTAQEARELIQNLGEAGQASQQTGEKIASTKDQMEILSTANQNMTNAISQGASATSNFSNKVSEVATSANNSASQVGNLAGRTAEGFGKMGDGVNYLSDRVGTVTQTFGNTSQELVKLQSSAAGAGEGFIQMGSKVVTLKDGVMTSIDNMSDSSLRFKSTSDASKIASDLASQGFQVLGATVKEVGGTSEVTAQEARELIQNLGEAGQASQQTGEKIASTKDQMEILSTANQNMTNAISQGASATSNFSNKVSEVATSANNSASQVSNLAGRTAEGFGKMGDGVNYLSDRVGTVTQTFGNTSQELVKLQSSAAGAGEGFIQMGNKVITLKDGVMTSIDNMSNSSLRFKSTSDASKIASDLASQGFQFLGATVKEVGGTSEVTAQEAKKLIQNLGEAGQVSQQTGEKIASTKDHMEIWSTANQNMTNAILQGTSATSNFSNKVSEVAISANNSASQVSNLAGRTAEGFGKMGEGVNYLSNRVGAVTQTFGNTSQELVKLQSSAAGAGEGFIQMGNKIITLKDGVMTSIDNMSDSSLRFKSTSDESKIASDLASQGFQVLGATVKKVGGTSEVTAQEAKKLIQSMYSVGEASSQSQESIQGAGAAMRDSALGAEQMAASTDFVAQAQGEAIQSNNRAIETMRVLGEATDESLDDISDNVQSFEQEMNNLAKVVDIEIAELNKANAKLATASSSLSALSAELSRAISSIESGSQGLLTAFGTFLERTATAVSTLLTTISQNLSGLPSVLASSVSAALSEAPLLMARAVSSAIKSAKFVVNVSVTAKAGKATGYGRLDSFAFGGYVNNAKRKVSKQEQQTERDGARKAGYKAGKVYRTSLYDGKGHKFDSIVNDAEDVFTIINSKGLKESFVIPPTFKKKPIEDYNNKSNNQIKDRQKIFNFAGAIHNRQGNFNIGSIDILNKIKEKNRERIPTQKFKKITNKDSIKNEVIIKNEARKDSLYENKKEANQSISDIKINFQEFNKENKSFLEKMSSEIIKSQKNRDAAMVNFINGLTSSLNSLNMNINNLYLKNKNNNNNNIHNVAPTISQNDKKDQTVKILNQIKTELQKIYNSNLSNRSGNFLNIKSIGMRGV